MPRQLLFQEEADEDEPASSQLCLFQDEVDEEVTEFMAEPDEGTKGFLFMDEDEENAQPLPSHASSARRQVQGLKASACSWTNQMKMILVQILATVQMERTQMCKVLKRLWCN